MNEWPLPRRNFVDCFGCSPRNDKGLQLQLWYTEKGCKSYYTISKEFCGFKGITHGGIVATLLDEVAAWTIITHLFKIGVTLQANVRYLEPVRTDEEVIIEGEIIENNEERVTVMTKILSKNGSVLAEAESKWLMPDPRFLQKITGISAHDFDKLFEETIGPIRDIQQKLNQSNIS